MDFTTNSSNDLHPIHVATSSYQPSYRRNVAEATNARHVFGAADLGLLSWFLGLCTTQKVLLPESSLAAKFAANLVLGSILSVQCHFKGCIALRSRNIKNLLEDLEVDKDLPQTRPTLLWKFTSH